MTTKVYSHQSQCRLKHGWRRKSDAKRAARKTETMGGGGRLQTYRCPHCGWWHNGHRVPS